MKVLFLEQFSDLGGGQRCMLDLLPAVRERGWNAVVAAPGSGPLFDRARDAGAQTAVIRLGPYTNGTKTAADSVRFSLDTLRLRSWIARQEAAVIYLSALRPLVAAALGAQGRPVVVHAQHFLAKRYAAAIAGWAIRRSNATLIADAEYVAEPLRRYVPASRIRVVYNGVEEIPFIPRSFGNGGQWKIGIVGRIAPMKGQTDFLRAAAILAPRLPNARFVICGSPMFSQPEYTAEVHRLAADLPVDFLGWRDDVASVLRELDLLVVPSTAAEATTRVILEAFSAGVPVVAYSVGGIPEILRDSETGFLVPERTPEALAARIRQVTVADLPSLSARARANWEQRFTIARYRSQMLAAIEEAAN